MVFHVLLSIGDCVVAIRSNQSVTSTVGNLKVTSCENAGN